MRGALSRSSFDRKTVRTVGHKNSKKTKNIVILAISLRSPIESSGKISPETSLILIILYRSSNINLGYSLMCSMAGFSISAITYFGREVSRNIESRRSTFTVFPEQINQESALAVDSEYFLKG